MLGDRSKILENEKGQSIFELIVFLPLLLVVLTMMITTGNAISSSINQLKVTRGYFYFLQRGNPTLQRHEFIRESSANNGITTIGFNAIGWRRADVVGSEESFSICYRYNSFLSNLGTDSNCDEPSLSGEAKTPFIRMFTVYGLCSETYVSTDGGVTHFVPHNFSGQADACVYAN